MISSSDPLALLKAAILARQRKWRAEKKEYHLMPCGAGGTELASLLTALLHTLYHASKGQGGGFARKPLVAFSPNAQCGRQNSKMTPRFLPHAVHALLWV